MAFLDLDLGEDIVLGIGSALRNKKPEISLVVICGEDEPPLLDKIQPWSLLRKPFYLPDLLRMLGEPVNEPEEQTDTPIDLQPESDEIPWLVDVNRAAQHLTRLTLESSAQAALITRQNALWAYAGGLSQDAANEIAATITRHWDAQKESDLLRFVRLDATRAEHMLYATCLSPGVVMALAFDAETPFSTIRSQANRLAKSLSIPEQRLETEATDISPKPKTESPESVEGLDAPLIGDDDDEFDVPSISSILYDIPPPRPVFIPVEEKAGPAILADFEAEPEIEYPTPLFETASVAQKHGHFSRESSPAVPLHEMFRADRNTKMETIAETRPSTVASELDVTASSKVQRPSTPLRPPAPGELDETRPSSVTEVARRVVLEPASPGLYNLTYACLLVPRFSGHYLAGDLADFVSKAMPEICIAFGWRLEFISVRPEYLQWVVSVPPSSSPGYLMRIIRQQTSERIFAAFPRLKKENPSGDFWAPGYLIMGGDQPHPPQLVKDYINQTRQRQGISRPHTNR